MQDISSKTFNFLPVSGNFCCLLSKIVSLIWIQTIGIPERPFGKVHFKEIAEKSTKNYTAMMDAFEFFFS